MADIAIMTPFSTAARYAPSLESWVPEYDGQRLAAYAVYEDIYWSQINVTSAEASEDDPIQLPIARSIIEAIVRYLAVDWDIYFDTSYGTPEARAEADAVFRNLFRREAMWSKFRTQCRWGLVKGDAIWYVTADPAKPAGSRISLHVLDPATYFPIFADDSDDRVIGVHIAEPVTFDKKPAIRRQTYRRTVDESGAAVVTGEVGYYDPTSWDDREGPLSKPPIKIESPEAVVPGLTQLPVYRVPNTTNPGDPYGSSVLRGLERPLRGIDQTITDEDLAVAIAGLGFFATDSKPPVDEDGVEKDWDIGPLRMVELGKNAEGKAATMQRISGVSSVEPSLSHAKYLESKINAGAAVPSIALGDVDTSVAESGIALFLRLSPLLAANAEREDAMLAVYDQMLYDLLHDWLPEYEDIDLDVIITSVVGDPMPVNREAKIAEILSLASATPPLITVEEARTALGKLGWSLADGGGDALLRQMQRQAAAVDPFSGRLTAEQQAEDVAAAA